MKKYSIDDFLRWKNRVKEDDLFLDVGCWSGSIVLEMMDRCDAYGVDFNRKTLKLADKQVANRLRYSDITKNIAFNKKFDWVLCSEVLEHIEEDDRALRNISKVIKRGGKLILTTPRSVRFFEFWDPAWVIWKLGGKERHWHYTLKELKCKMNSADLKIVGFAVRGDFRWIVVRWINVILKYLFGMKFQITNIWRDGFVDWMILAEKI